MKTASFLVLFLLLQNTANAFELQKAKKYSEKKQYIGWLMSEKLDGIRAYWDGTQLYTRKGKKINAPSWFTQKFPPFKLDGELWTKRQDFENIQSIVLDSVPSQQWQQISYQLFEVPFADGFFQQRLAKVQNWFKENPNPAAHILPQHLIKTNQQISTFLQQVIAKKGEGVMLKNPNKSYFYGRSSDIVKLKQFDDMEARVLKINEGKGKYTNQMGSLTVQLANGIVFKIGSGFSNLQRQNPPKIGDIIRFKYIGFTKNGIPKFASFIHLRKD